MVLQTMNKQEKCFTDVTGDRSLYKLGSLHPDFQQQWQLASYRQAVFLPQLCFAVAHEAVLMLVQSGYGFRV